MISAVVFDVDGVLLESVDIKTRAFASLFARYPEHLQTIVQFHLNNGGMSRFEKFRVIYRDILKRPLSEEEFASLCLQFRGIVFNEILRCEPVKGSREFLEKYHDRYKFFVATATPQEEIQEILGNRGLWHYFRAVYGSPTPKDVALKNILQQFEICQKDIIFVGDDIGDYDAAVGVGIKFIGRLHDGNLMQLKSLKPIDTIRDLSELEQKIGLS